MAWIAVRDGIPFVTDSGRVYFGTDTHAMTLLVGAVLATYWSQRGAIAALTPQARRTVSGIGLASLVGLVAAFRFVDPMSWALYRGGFLWVGVLTAGVVAAAAVNGTGVRPGAVGATTALGRSAVVRHLPLALADLHGAAPGSRPRGAWLARRGGSLRPHPRWPRRSRTATSRCRCVAERSAGSGPT